MLLETKFTFHMFLLCCSQLTIILLKIRLSRSPLILFLFEESLCTLNFHLRNYICCWVMALWGSFINYSHLSFWYILKHPSNYLPYTLSKLPNSDIQDARYTIIMVDPDANSKDKSAYFRHWLIHNIKVCVYVVSKSKYPTKFKFFEKVLSCAWIK